MNSYLAIGLVLVGSVAHGASPEVSREKLARMAPLPTINISFGVTLDQVAQFQEVYDDETVEVRIQELRDSLKQSPNDPDVMRELGNLLRNPDQQKEAQQLRERRLQVLRARVETEPHNGRLLADLGEALSHVDQMEEAEVLFRRSTEESPDDWYVWAARADFLTRKAMATQSNDGDSASDTRPKAEQVQLARGYFAEAEECLDRAVELEAKLDQVYYRRAQFKKSRTLWEQAVQPSTDENEQRGNFTKRMKPVLAALPDIQQAALLSDTNYFAWSAVAMVESMSQINAGATSFTEFSESSADSIRMAMIQLNRMSENPNREIAAGALEGLVTVEFTAKMGNLDKDSVIDKLQRAVRLNPDRVQPWNMLIGLLSFDPNRSAELVDVCSQQLEHSKSVRNEFLVIKALSKAGRNAAALEAAEQAITDYPDNLQLNLTAAALLMQQGTDEESLQHAEAHLRKAIAAVRKLRPSSDWPDLREELMLNSAIWMALNGQVEAAVRGVEQVLNASPDNPKARAILEQLKHWQ